MIRPRTATLRCPQCGFSYQAPVFSIIDIGQTPELKQVMMAGQINASQCPNCGNINYVGTPILYHDPEHEFAGVFIPQQLNLKHDQREKAIGDLTKSLMDALPAEQRRYYMLNPQQFFTMDGLVEKVLGFEGITPEMIAASRRKIELVEELSRKKDDAMALSLAVKENEALLDQEFFSLLSNFIYSTQAEGQAEAAQQLADLREKLLPLTEVGHTILKQRQAVQNLGRSPDRKSVLKAVLDGDLEEVEAITVVARPLLDYRFFEEYTKHVEAASGDARQRLESKRERMLQILETLRAADQQVMQQASQILQDLLSAEDMAEAVRQNLPYIDQTVISVLLSNIDNAEKRGAKAAAQRLRDLWEMINKQMEETIPPELHLLYLLTDAEYPEQTREILRQHKDQVNAEFLTFLKESIQAIEKEAATDPERGDVVRHLRNVLTQAQLGA